MAPVPGRDEACSHSPTAGPTDQGPRLHWEADSRGRGYRQSFQTTPAGEGNTARLPRVRRAARAGSGESTAFSIAAWAHALRVFQAVFRGRLDVSKRKGHWLPRKRYPPGVRTLWRFDYWNRAGGARPDRVLRLGVRRGRRKDPPWVKATFADGPATKSPVSKGICTIYGKHRIIAHQTDPWQLIPPSPCTKVTVPANKEGNH
ncbi:hypothetical protein Celaphus_00018645 [Cervus elaphus hippelaphus]|uniref:Uncharacterized protein n=1 Tax=Cervus elaphus hippelaphus TaxID=46360 RepID=A0A212CMG4_CEREH|nr:hypothetical protein Celaphus_00018645 [Cervus elaphus hippelaphus]